jgi:glycine/D-amino acid oxidase-like deaminating enzyme
VSLVRDCEALARHVPTPFEVVPAAEQAREIESPLYHGGVVYPDDVAVHPLKLLRGLHARAVAAGALLRDHCAVSGLRRERDGFDVATNAGVIRARQVLIATNGYTGAFSPWHQRRVIPIGSYIIATDQLDASLVTRLIPRGRNVGDTRRVVVYVRPSADGRRILFGGRAAAGETDVVRCVPRLRSMMSELFPPLADVAISHAWMGFVGFTFDTMPHFGERDGVFHSLGYCGQGVPLATYYGRRIGQRMIGDPEGRTALEGLAFGTRAYYRGKPWFLPAAVAAYRLRDALGV